jgi:hypothetical protein
VNEWEVDPPPPKAPKIAVPRSTEPMLTPGTYSLAFVDYETAEFMGRTPKVTMRFKVLDSRYPAQPVVKRHYNVRALDGEPRPFGSFVPEGPRSHLVREFLTLFPAATELDLDLYRSVEVMGSIETVCKDGDGNPTPGPLHYSKVARLLAPAEFSSAGD